MEEAFVAKLLGVSALTAIVGQRITWARRDQGGALPAVVLYVIDGVPDYHLGGGSGLTESRIQVDCWGPTYLSAKSAARAIKAALSGARFDHGGIRFDAVLVADERDETTDENGTPLFRTSLDLMVHHAI